MANQPVVTRFAPSPTGFLHIGGARTALFNWLFARSRGGEFRLRIEDTDRTRSTKEAADAIVEGLRWLGLDWDGDIVSQNSRRERHAAAASELLSRGRAYKCFSTPEEIEEARARARADGRPTLFASPWRNAEPSSLPGGPHAVRLRTPDSGETRIADAVHGSVAWKNSTIEDLVLLRSDGTPTYNLAVVLDDTDMGVTHVIRGDDHLANSAKQLMIYKAFGWDAPVFAHIPLIHDEDGKKLSKRGGAAGTKHYRDAGILPEAMRNYLARLGWSHGDEEFFTTAQAIEWFSLEGIRRSPARLDWKKMLSLSRHHIAAADDRRLLQETDAFLSAIGENSLSDPSRSRFATALPILKSRAHTLGELLLGAAFAFVDRPLTIDQDGMRVLEGSGRELLQRIVPVLESADADWNDRDALHQAVWRFASEAGLTLGAVALPLRTALTGGGAASQSLLDMAPPLSAAVTGKRASISVFDIMVVIGRSEAIARIGDAARPPARQ